MSCRQVRDDLMLDERPSTATEHLAGCPECSEFAHKLDHAKAAFRSHQSEHLPGPGFALRVRDALPGPRSGQLDLLGWAALRLLPATLALTLVLSAWCWLATPGPAALFEQSPTDDLLTWVMEDGS